MWLPIRVFSIICLVTSPLVGAQQQLIFTPANNAQSRNVNVPQELIFASSNSNPLVTSNSANQGLIFTNTNQAKPYDASIFSTTANYYPNQNIYDRPPIFASSRAVDERQAASSNVFSSSVSATSSPQSLLTSFATGRSSVSSVADTSVPTSFGPPVFASKQSKVPARNSLDVGEYAEQSLRNLSKGAEEFSLEFLAKISNEHLSVPHRSYMVSPLSIWSLLVLLTEGAEDVTLRELRNTLRLNNNPPQSLRSAYRQINQRLNTVTNFVEVASYQAIFTDINKPVQRDYEDIVEREYLSVLTPVDFGDVNATFMRINDEVSKATRGLLPHSILPQDLIDVHMLMMSSLYFKGKWKYPFEAFNTHLLPFHDEEGNVTGDVEMMMQLGSFTYVQVNAIDSFVLELPYGQLNRLSMLVILPKKGSTVNKVVNSLQTVGISSIMQQLEAEEQLARDEGVPNEVEVYLPKFTTQSHFSVRYILEKMGLVDIFQPAFANLTKISKDVFVSSIFQSTRIIVNEDGTEAAALSIASLTNKASPARFYLDRPFAYLIVEKTANLLLFAGEIKSHK